MVRFRRNRITRTFSVDVHRMPFLPFSWAFIAPNAERSAVIEKWVWKPFGKSPIMLLKFFIQHAKSLVIRLISSINSLRCPLSSCSELVSFIIVTNKHLRCCRTWYCRTELLCVENICILACSKLFAILQYFRISDRRLDRKNYQITKQFRSTLPIYLLWNFHI